MSARRSAGDAVAGVSVAAYAWENARENDRQRASVRDDKRGDQERSCAPLRTCGSSAREVGSAGATHSWRATLRQAHAMFVPPLR